MMQLEQTSVTIFLIMMWPLKQDQGTLPEAQAEVLLVFYVAESNKQF